MPGVVAPNKTARSGESSSVATVAEPGDGHERIAASEGVMATWRIGPRRTFSFIRYSLLWCPPVPAANFVLTRREAPGKRRVLRIGRVESLTPIYNLAQLRYAGALLGADEIHVHIPAGGARARRRIDRQMIEALESDTLQCRIG